MCFDKKPEKEKNISNSLNDYDGYTTPFKPLINKGLKWEIVAFLIMSKLKDLDSVLLSNPRYNHAHP